MLKEAIQRRAGDANDLKLVAVADDQPLAMFGDQHMAHLIGRGLPYPCQLVSSDKLALDQFAFDDGGFDLLLQLNRESDVHTFLPYAKTPGHKGFFSFDYPQMNRSRAFSITRSRAR